MTELSALLTRHTQAHVVLKFVGGLYLLWLALNAALATLSAGGKAAARTDAATSLPALFRRGMLMQLGSAKSVPAWLAITSIMQDWRHWWCRWRSPVTGVSC